MEAKSIACAKLYRLSIAFTSITLRLMTDLAVPALLYIMVVIGNCTIMIYQYNYHLLDREFYVSNTSIHICLWIYINSINY